MTDPITAFGLLVLRVFRRRPVAPPSALPGISPTRGEIGEPDAFATLRAELLKQIDADTEMEARHG